MKDLLIIFTRNPQLGKCKTRLAATVGDRAALEIYKFLLKHTADVAGKVNAVRHVYYSEEIGTNDIWDDKQFEKRQQMGSHLGIRMQQAFENGFAAGFERILLIGSDLYDLGPSDLNSAFEALDHHDFVLGPAEDGGYYLIGSRKVKKEVFERKNWGTETVLRDTLSDLEGESLFLLPERNDVDVYEDIQHIEVFQQFLNDLK
ncbi:MAG: TIGR04282 family arsenosugar biosynthesis glycosyltransferase [Bacteroidota bacterium]